jgi:hypothetical protein
LQKNIVPISFQLLSIDIDSYDLAVFENLNNFIPFVVVIEIDSSIKPGIISSHSKKILVTVFQLQWRWAFKKIIHLSATQEI